MRKEKERRGKRNERKEMKKLNVKCIFPVNRNAYKKVKMVFLKYFGAPCQYHGTLIW